MLSFSGVTAWRIISAARACLGLDGSLAVSISADIISGSCAFHVDLYKEFWDPTNSSGSEDPWCVSRPPLSPIVLILPAIGTASRAQVVQDLTMSQKCRTLFVLISLHLLLDGILGPLSSHRVKLDPSLFVDSQA